MVVNPCCHEVLVHNLGSVNNRLANILTARCRNWIQSQVFLDCWVYRTLSNFRGWHLIYVGNPFGLTDSFIVGEKEGLVLDDRPADASPKLIPLKRCFVKCRVLKIIARVQSTVADKLIDAAVEIVGSGAGDSIYHTAGSFPIFRGIVAGQYGKLLNSVNAKIAAEDAAWSSIRVVIQANPVETVVVLLRPGARNGELLPKAAITAIRSRGEARLSLDGLYAGLKSGKVGPPAAVP